MRSLTHHALLLAVAIIALSASPAAAFVTTRHAAKIDATRPLIGTSFSSSMLLLASNAGSEDVAVADVKLQIEESM